MTTSSECSSACSCFRNRVLSAAVEGTMTRAGPSSFTCRTAPSGVMIRATASVIQDGADWRTSGLQGVPMPSAPVRPRLAKTEQALEHLDDVGHRCGRCRRAGPRGRCGVSCSCSRASGVSETDGFAIEPYRVPEFAALGRPARNRVQIRSGGRNGFDGLNCGERRAGFRAPVKRSEN